jgi:hypothetical protein
MIVQFFKRIWPRLRIPFGVAYPRSKYITTETGALLTDEKGEVLTTN